MNTILMTLAEGRSEPGTGLHRQEGAGLADLLAALRRRRELGAAQVACKAGVAASTVRRWEADDTSPRQTELTSVLEAMGATDEEKCVAFALLDTRRGARSRRPSPTKPLGQAAETAVARHLSRVSLSHTTWR